MSRFTTAQLDYLNSQAEHLLNAMRQLLTHNPAVDMRAIVHRLRSLAVTYGRPGIAHLVRDWFDRVIAATPGAEPGHDTIVTFTNATFTAPLPAEQVTAEYRWVADVLAAHLAGNQADVYRLIDAVPAGEKSTIHLVRALEVAATVLASYDTPGEQPFRPGMYYLTEVGLLPA